MNRDRKLYAPWPVLYPHTILRGKCFPVLLSSEKSHSLTNKRHHWPNGEEDKKSDLICPLWKRIFEKYLLKKQLEILHLFNSFVLLSSHKKYLLCSHTLCVFFYFTELLLHLNSTFDKAISNVICLCGCPHAIMWIMIFNIFLIAIIDCLLLSCYTVTYLGFSETNLEQIVQNEQH